MKRHCDECQHGAALLRRIDCALSHEVSFAMPRNPLDQEWGFYRTDCEDFTPIQRVQQAAPAQETSSHD